METKKEVQITILPKNNNKATNEEFLNILRVVSPGTNFRSAIDGALKSGRGALILVETGNSLNIFEGGFKVNCRFTPQRLIELAKMDGAIVMSTNLKKILYANVLLTPNSKIETSETGTRHKAAERAAKQTSGLIIAISERRHEITIFYKNKRYTLQSTDHLLRKANENIQLLEKQRELFDKNLERLNHLELRNSPGLNQALITIQKGRLIEKIAAELKKQVIELGIEGSLIKTRLKEIIHGVEKETNFIIKDYTKLDLKKSRFILETLTYDELTDEENILKVLAFETISNVNARGWRILSKTSLQEQDINTIITEMKSIGKAINSNIRDISNLLDKDRAQIFRDEISRIKMTSQF